jgi:excisionase family DNA binding protein
MRRLGAPGKTWLRIPGDRDSTTAGVPKLLLTPEEAARALGVGRDKVYELMRLGQLRSVKVGGSRRVPVRALEAFVDELERDSAPAVTG